VKSGADIVTTILGEVLIFCQELKSYAFFAILPEMIGGVSGRLS